MSTDGADSEAEAPPREPVTRERLAISVSVASLAVSIVVGGLAWFSADAAREQASQAVKQTELLSRAATREAEAQARSVNLTADTFGNVLRLDNASPLPLRRIELYLADPSGEPAVTYDVPGEVGPCRSLTWDVVDTDPLDLVVEFTDAEEVTWLLYPGGGLTRYDPEPFATASDLRAWEVREGRVDPCGR